MKNLINFLSNELEYSNVSLISQSNDTYKFTAEAFDDEYILIVTPFERDEQHFGYSVTQYNKRTQKSNFVYDIELTEL